MVALLLACSAQPKSVDTGGDTGPDATDSGDSAEDSAGDTAREMAEIVVTNTGEAVLVGAWYDDEGVIMDGAGLEPGRTTSWPVYAGVPGNLVYTDPDTELCWGVSDVLLSPGEEVSFDLPAPQGQEGWHENGLWSCDFPGEGA